MHQRFLFFLLLPALLSLGACAVGPDFVPPEQPKAARYTEDPLPERTAGQTPGTGQIPAGMPATIDIPAIIDIPGAAGKPTPGEYAASAHAAQRFTAEQLPRRWWKLFHCPALNALIERALTAGPGPAEAVAALEQARELWRAEVGLVWSPAVDAFAAALPQQSSASGLSGAVGAPSGVTGGGSAPRPSPFTLYAAGVNVSYTFDLFGGGRRELEALAAEGDYREYELEAARLSVAANVAAAAVRDAGLRELVRTTKLLIETRRKQVAVAERRFQAGGVSLAEVKIQRRELAYLEQNLPPLESALAANRHMLAVLAGSVPAEAALPQFSLADFTLPEDLPLSLPGDTVRGRPDVQAAEALLHKASARVGTATANLYPRITLVGWAGYSARHRDELFIDSSGIWGLGLSLLQPVFHGGRLRAQKNAAEAAFRQAEAAWKQVVLRGYADIADALAALTAGAKNREAAARAAGEAEGVYRIVKERHRLGGVSLLEALDAERAYRKAAVAEVQAILDRYTQTIALFQALGNGTDGPAAGRTGQAARTGQAGERP